MEVITGTDISGQVQKLISESRELLVLVSPYFDPWDRLTTEVKLARTRPNLRPRLLLRGGPDREKQEPKARALIDFGVEVSYLKRLHAKIYLNESHAIVTSLNLVEASVNSSWEIAIRVDSVRDAVAYRDIVKYAAELLDRAHGEEAIAAQPEKASAHAALHAVLGGRGAPAPSPARPSAPAPGRTPAPAAPVRPAPASSAARKRAGRCIRCSDEIAFDVEHPYCASCYRSWSRYKNPDYDEEHCHSCGKAKVTTMAKPLCKPCWEAST